MWNIFTPAGDVSELNGEVVGLWGPAMEQGKVAGMNMAATSVSYQKAILTTVFNAFNVTLFSIGLVDESQCDTTITEEDGAEKYTRVFINDNKIVGVISLEGVVASMPYKTAIEKEVSLDGIDFNHVSICDLLSEVKERLKVPA